MFSKSKLFAIFVISASMCAATFAQVTPIPLPQPQRIQRPLQVFTDDGGSYLGVQMLEVTKENFSKFGLREVRGVAVEKVLENSPAVQAGLQAGDVIVRFEGEEVSSVRKLRRLINEVAPDHQAKMTVLRGGRERELTATMGKLPSRALESAWGLPGIPEYPNQPIPRAGPIPPYMQDFLISRGDARQIGVGVAPLTKQLGDYFGVTDGRGLLVNSVRENSPAAKAGLKAGDVITEVDGKAVNEMFDLARVINEKKEGDVTLTIIRNKSRQTIKVTPEKMQNFNIEKDSNSRREFRLKTEPSNPVIPYMTMRVPPLPIM